MSSYSAGNFKQDMPPPGGYEEIHYKRIPAQRLVSYKTLFFANCIMTAYGYYYYHNRRKYMFRMKADYYDYEVAIEPLVSAESDRAFLRQLRHNRNVEKDLMKNVKDWKVGTLWGMPVYKRKPDGAIPNIALGEFYAHRPSYEHRDFSRPNWHVGFEDCDH